MRGYALTPKARADLADIWDYTAENWNEEQADAYVRLIAKACADLAQGRAVGRNADHVRTGYAAFSVGAHVLYYKTSAPARIEVIRILHQRMDVARHV